MNRLDGKVAIVTGGSSGIGIATVKQFVAAGAEVLIGDLQPPREALPGVAYETADVCDPARVEALVAGCVKRFGRLDVVFNNAGIEFHGPLTATEPADHRPHGRRQFERRLLRSPVRRPRDAHERRTPARGSIINTASVAGLTGCPGMSTYNATKAAVVMLTKNASLEYGPFGIRVNAICPGIIRTPMALAAVGNDTAYLDEIGRKAHPLGRVGEPEEIAKLVGFLASDDASFISGAAIPIDGAMTAGFSSAPGWEPSPS